MAATLTGCTNLDEQLYGRLTPDNYYQTEEQALASLAGCYEYTAYMSRAGGDSWRIGEYGTDELFCPGRANGGWYDEYVNQLMEHRCTPDNDRLNTCWKTYIFPGIGADNAVLEAMQASPVADKLSGPIAETRALRAYEYFYAMDYFGIVPLSPRPPRCQEHAQDHTAQGGLRLCGQGVSRGRRRPTLGQRCRCQLLSPAHQGGCLHAPGISVSQRRRVQRDRALAGCHHHVRQGHQQRGLRTGRPRGRLLPLHQ